MTTSLQELLHGLRASGQGTRLRLLAILSHGELTVGEITRIIGQSQPRVSRHLKLLGDAGLLDRFREQHWVFYRVPHKGEGADLVRSLLALLDSADETLRLDCQRLEEVKAERAALAPDYLRQYVQHAGDIAPLSVADEQVNAAILEVLDGSRIGELLDIGTGTGRMLKLLGPAADHAVGVDISSEMLLVARTNLHAAGLDQCLVRHGNMYRLPFGDDSYDTVTMDQVLSEADEPEAAVLEAARILRGSGQILVIDFAAGASAIDGRRPLSGEELETWFAGAGLVCERISRVSGPAVEVILSRACRAHRSEGRAA